MNYVKATVRDVNVQGRIIVTDEQYWFFRDDNELQRNTAYRAAIEHASVANARLAVYRPVDGIGCGVVGVPN